ncbi:MAG: VOC family protein [Deltaproteobacteria bacterium]|nr:VOC family protein [Deltaproteobacteria bacterium]
MIRGGRVRLGVADVERAVRFYVETLGMKLVEDGGLTHAVIDAGDGLHVELAKGAAVHDQGGQSSVTELGLASKIPLGEAMAILENRGVALSSSEGGGATRARFSDPDGNRLYLFQGH